MTVLASALRAAQVPPFHAMAMARRAAAIEATGRRVRHLEVGQPAAPAPPSARAAAMRALEAGAHQSYTNAPGLPALRHRITEHYRDWYGIDVPVERVFAVAGASAGFTLAFLACFDAGQRVGVLEPGYPCYRNALVAFGVDAVPLPVGPETSWSPTTALLEAARPLDGVVVASPSNPTGTVMATETLRSIAAWARRERAHLISDEIYHGITYGRRAETMLAVEPEAFVVGSFSKYFCMTGWRIGWVVVPDGLVDAVERLQQNLYICAPALSQAAATAAFDDQAVLDAEVQRYANNRSILSDGLRAAGICHIADADGAFYVYADVSHLTADAAELCDRWLHEIGVAATPGLDFDLARGRRFVRFSYAGDRDDIAAACDALAAWRP